MEKEKCDSAEPTVERVRPGAAVKLAFPNLTVDRKGKPAAVNLRIPENRDVSKPVHFITYFGGGNSDGGCIALIEFPEFFLEKIEIWREDFLNELSVRDSRRMTSR